MKRSYGTVNLGMVHSEAEVGRQSVVARPLTGDQPPLLQLPQGLRSCMAEASRASYISSTESRLRVACRQEAGIDVNQNFPI